MNPYVPHTPDDVRRMLERIGVSDVEALFSDIPPEVRARHRPLGLPAKDELTVIRYLTSRAEQSPGARVVPFLGGGLYDHYIPPVVGHVLSRSEFFTAYTPYQAELSQGTLTWMLEYQTMICELTGMEVANASMYDGATALAEAVLMAARATGGRTVLVPRSLFPHVREVLATYAWGAGLTLADVPYGPDGRLALGTVPEGTCALVVQQPNAFGILEDLSGLKDRLGKALLIAYANPIVLAVVEPPGSFGADVVVGEGQVLGNPLAFGGPLLGFFATRMEHLRRMPGRVSGETRDAQGKVGYVMTFQTREQHIRREGATSNICTNSALCALAATVYLAALGPGGLRRVALLAYERAHALAERIGRIPGHGLAFPGPFFHEFVVRCPDPAGAVARLRRAGIAVLPPEFLQPLGVRDGFPVAVTEKRTDEELELFVSALEGEMSTIYDRGAPGRRAVALPPLRRPEEELLSGIPPALRRRTLPRLPEVSQPELVRHYTELSRMNYGVDTGFYPLGSCTMKYNPKLHEDLARLPGFAGLHPLLPPEACQGALAVLWELGELLKGITGMPGVTLQPAAGAHGELTGMLLLKRWLEDRGETGRTKVLLPDSAHGTNPASAAMVGFSVVSLPSDRRGMVDLEALKRALGPDVAGIMLTVPNTLGIFEEEILEITDLVHGAGGLCYFDGANFNAYLGRARPGDMGADIFHINLHKTFSTPHGGGGPGAGPVTVSEPLLPYLPVPGIVRRGDRFELDWNRPKSIGRVHPYFGNFLVAVRALAYILTLGDEGMREVSAGAVLAANYLKALLKDVYRVPYDRLVKHEFVLSGAGLGEGIRTLDIAKRLMDYGFHPPTIYFPLIVPEALMIEPTETEPKEVLDAFAEALRAIAREAREDPQLLKEAPHGTPVRRLDEARAVREPRLRIPFEKP